MRNRNPVYFQQWAYLTVSTPAGFCRSFMDVMNNDFSGECKEAHRVEFKRRAAQGLLPSPLPNDIAMFLMEVTANG